MRPSRAARPAEPPRYRLERIELPPKRRLHARFAGVVVGFWLALSAFVFPHSDSSRANVWITGLLVMLAALLTIRFPVARPLNSLLAIWLIVTSAVLYPGSELTFWHDLGIGLVLFMLSVLPNRVRAAQTMHG